MFWIGLLYDDINEISLLFFKVVVIRKLRVNLKFKFNLIKLYFFKFNLNYCRQLMKTLALQHYQI